MVKKKSLKGIAKEIHRTANKLIHLGCDRIEAKIAAKALFSLESGRFFSDREMAAINNCADKVLKKIGERHESFY
jgi:hypothetical protein